MKTLLKEKRIRYILAACFSVIFLALFLVIPLAKEQSVKEGGSYALIAVALLFILSGIFIFLMSLRKQRAWIRFYISIAFSVGILILSVVAISLFVEILDLQNQQATLESVYNSAPHDEQLNLWNEMLELNKKIYAKQSNAFIFLLVIQFLFATISFMANRKSSRNLERAVTVLQSDSKLTCVLIKETDVFASEKNGIQPMLNFIESGKNLKGFAVADKIVGKAAALLFAYAGVKTIFAEVLSKKAIPVLKKFRIDFFCETETDEIKNRQGNGSCPMEQAVASINEPKEALEAIKQKLEELKVMQH